MAARKIKVATKKADEPLNAENNTMKLIQEKGKTKEQQFAEIALSPPTLNTLTACTFTQGLMGETSIYESVGVMLDKMDKVKAGDFSDLEATLAAQAVSLNAIFNEMARRCSLNMGEHLHATESYMRLALKAQAQCARTIEVLATMKNPPVIFAKQANIAQGHQQVNNGSGAPLPAHTGKTINQPNELLEAQHGSKTMDSAATQTASPKNPAMATLD